MKLTPEQTARAAAWLARQTSQRMDAAGPRKVSITQPDYKHLDPAALDPDAILAAVKVHCEATGEKCPACLTPQLIGRENTRVEVTDADGEKQRFQVGKSTGWMPVHLELHNKASSGGYPVYGAPFQSIREISTRRY